MRLLTAALAALAAVVLLTPDESKSEWDLAKIIATIPGEQAFRPLAEGGCPLVKK